MFHSLLLISLIVDTSEGRDFPVLVFFASRSGIGPATFSVRCRDQLAGFVHARVGLEESMGRTGVRCKYASWLSKVRRASCLVMAYLVDHKLLLAQGYAN